MLNKSVLTKNKSRGNFMAINRFNEIKLFSSGNIKVLGNFTLVR